MDRGMTEGTELARLAVHTDMPAPGGERAGLSPGGRATTPPARVRWARGGYLVLAWALVACLSAQVFIAGLAIFVTPTWWAWHTTFIHTFEFLPVVMLALAFAGRLTRGMRWLTAALWVQIILQYATANSGGTLAALHPVNALVFFWLAVTLAHQAWRVARGAKTGDW